MQNLAEVKLWGRLVGALSYDSNTQLTSFQYAEKWVKSGIEIAPLHMPLSAQASQVFQFPQLNTNTYRGLPAIFADTLPDDFGNAVISAWLAKNGRDSASFNSIERLLYTGNRGMGALEFEPAVAKPNNHSETLELNSLIRMAQNILDQRGKLIESIDPDNDFSALLHVGTSAGGARAKALVAINKERTQIRSGQIDAPVGFEHFLLKFDGVEENKRDSEVFGDPQGFGRMEYAYYLMAKDCGINISYSELLIDENRAHFITQRFDRDDNHKKHYASLCAMDHADYKQPGSYSYEQLLAVARILRLPRKDAIEIYRRMVFNVIARNHDDHTKNTGFLLDSTQASTLRTNSQQAGWRLSPAFDLAYSYKKGSPWVNSHQMSINGKREGFNREDLFSVADLIGNFKTESRLIFEEVMAVVENWQQYADEVDVFDGFAQEIKRNLRLSL